MNKEKFNVFFSWQSENVKENKYTIKCCLKKTSKTLKKEFGYEIEIEEGTDYRTSGSPNIINTIFEKIDKCDVFVCDVSIINSNFDENTDFSLTPNPNVMFELGYAVNLLGWERIICINNLQFGKTEELPFDIRGNRISKYNSSEDGFKTKLESTLKIALKAIIDNYEELLADHNSNDIKSHERNIASKFLEICSEQSFYDSINGSRNNMQITQKDFDLWQKYENYYKDSLNWFSNSNLDSKVKFFIHNLVCFELKCSEIFFWHKDEQYSDKYNDRVYKFPKEPKSGENHAESHRRLHSEQTELVELGNQVKTSYQEIILSIKINGLLQ